MIKPIKPLMLSRDPLLKKVVIESHERLCRLMKDDGFILSSFGYVGDPEPEKPLQDIGFYGWGRFWYAPSLRQAIRAASSRGNSNWGHSTPPFDLLDGYLHFSDFPCPPFYIHIRGHNSMLLNTRG